MICELEAGAVHARTNEVCEILVPLRGAKATRLACRIVSGSGDVTLVAFSGSLPIAEFHEQWRFTTHVPNLQGGYYERWLPVNEKRKRFYLDRAYLHLYKAAREGGLVVEKEILALHCDPNEPDEPAHWHGLRHSSYKRGPHLHVTVAEQPIPHSHFALNACHLDFVLRSMETLTHALRTAVRMIEDQVLQLYVL